MLYNKDKFKKINDRKVLHKVHKHWLVVSSTLLLALGGGAAVANHASANTTSEPSQGQNNNNQVTQSKNQPNQFQLVRTTSNGAAQSQTPSNQIQSSASDFTQSTSSAASTTSSIDHYATASTNGISAASYHAKANQDSTIASNTSNMINSYVGSINQELDSSAASSVAVFQSAYGLFSQNASSYAVQASSYAKFAQNSQNGSIISSLAENFGYGSNVSGYIANVAWQNSSYTSAVSSASANVNNIQMINSLAQSLMLINPAEARASASIAELAASDNAKVASANVAAADSSYGKLKSQSNNNYVNLYDAETSSIDNSYSAKATNLSPSLAGKYASLSITYNSEYQSALANQSNYNLEISSASVAESDAQNSLNSANSLASHAAAEYSLYNMNGMTSASVLSLMSQDFTSANDPIGAIKQFMGDVYGDQAGQVGQDLIGNLMSSGYTSSLAEIKQNPSLLTPYLHEAGSLAANGNLSPASATSAYYATTSKATKIQGQLAMASESYAYANDTNVTLANYFASSYSTDASLAINHTSKAQEALDVFYATHGDHAREFYAMERVEQEGKGDYIQDSKQATAYAKNVLENSPKYITTSRGVWLHDETDFNQPHTGSIPRGSELTVTGVGFSRTGNVRYIVSYNGKAGYITSNSNYVMPTYLPAQNNVDVTMLKAGRLYRTPIFSRNSFTGKEARVNGVLHNVNVVAEDQQKVGGFTRIQLPGGDYMTANTKYVQVTGHDNQQPQNTNSTQTTPQIPTYGFYDTPSI